jgi:hypothetical protein
MNYLYYDNILNYISIYEVEQFPNNFFSIKNISKKFLLLKKINISKISFNLLIEILDYIIINKINYDFNNIFYHYDTYYNNKDYLALRNRYNDKYKKYFRDKIYPIVFE